MEAKPEAAKGEEGLQPIHYEDFSIKIGGRRGDGYPVFVDSPAGQWDGILRFPLKDGTPDPDWLQGSPLRDAEGPHPAGDRDLGSPHRRAEPVPHEVGGRLFQTLFSGQVLSLFERSVSKVEDSTDCGLRIKLHFMPGQEGTDRLLGLPWELLYWAERRQFLSLSRTSPVVRFLSLPRPPNALPTESLRILGVMSRVTPPGTRPLDLDRERVKLEQACSGLTNVSVEFLPEATPRALRRALHEKPFHVLLFMGHGTFQEGEGALVFEREDGSPDLVPGAMVANIVRDFPTLRLVHLSACSTARMGEEKTEAYENKADPFAGVAAALVLAGMPAVIAMQHPISDQAAIQFSQAFYSRLAAGDPVDAAATEGRMAIHLASPGSTEWATPVLFLRVPNGKLFEPVPAPPPIPRDIQEKIIDFSSLITKKTEGFVGRKWIFEAIEGFTREKPSGYFVLRGDPGIGKSAMIARMVKDGGHVHHFNVRAEGIQKAEIFLRNVCAQLVAKYQLGLSSLPPEAAQDSRFLNSLLTKVAARLQGERAIVLVDALDESDRTGLPPDANTLYLPTVLPGGIYVVVTTRRTGPVPRIDCDQQILDIEQDSAGNIADVRELVESKLPLPGIQAYIVAQQLDDETFVAELVGKSQGNFMYLYYVLPEIERGAYKDRKFGQLPVGLQGYYEDHWRRMRHRDEKAWFEVQLPILVALTVVKEPVSIDLIADFSEIQDRRQIRTVLQAWDQFLYTAQAQDDEGRPQKRFRLYHESFHDFIADKDEVADERISLKRAHGKIADVLWRDLYGDL